MLILSHHNFERTLSLEELRAKEAEMRAQGAAVAKLAMTAQDIIDAWTMLQLLQDRSGAASDLVFSSRSSITVCLGLSSQSGSSLHVVCPPTNACQSCPGVCVC